MVRNVHMVGIKPATAESSAVSENNVPVFSESLDRTEEALETFQLVKHNEYIDRLKGVYSAANEVMTCDCTERRVAGVNVACGADSDCINRLTNVECVDGECSCGARCQNQRFQRNQMADISIFLTEHKGYGMRANCDIPANTFIIEYKGEVIDEQAYKIRKEAYAKEGIKHFYFMMIQDGQIIDATKKGSLGRFCNHSCDPNAYVEKWVVNKRYRMGIFAKRKIPKGEEITFDYNVDRYGAEPQKCYCGAKNCVGYLGGKTQTEVLRLLTYAARDALGISAADENRWIKFQKKQGITISEENVASKVNDFVNSLELNPLEMSDVAKVSSFLLLPNNNPTIIDRVLERFDPNDPGYSELLHRFNRFHGLRALTSCIQTILDGNHVKHEMNAREKDVLKKVITILSNWPKLASKNTVKSCDLESLLRIMSQELDDNKINILVDDILDGWKDLRVVYRIPKRTTSMNGDATFLAQLDYRRSRSTQPLPANTSTPPHNEPKEIIPHSQKPWADVDVESLPDSRKIDGIPLPPGWNWTTDAKTGARYYYNRRENITQWEPPSWGIENVAKNPVKQPRKEMREEDINREKREKRRTMDEQFALRELQKKRRQEQKKAVKVEEQKLKKLSSIIAEASSSSEIKKAGSRSASKVHFQEYESHHHKHHFDSDRSQVRDGDLHKKYKREWMLLFASVVPNMLKKYEDHIGRENLKNCAREITHVLTNKELGRHKNQDPPAKISKDRKKKIWAFVSNYMDKFIMKFDSKKREHSSSHVGTSQKRQKV